MTIPHSLKKYPFLYRKEASAQFPSNPVELSFYHFPLNLDRNPNKNIFFRLGKTIMITYQRIKNNIPKSENQLPSAAR